jgi:8-oxo-dGTP pyrophosphatase MutT (NUDIX family)
LTDQSPNRSPAARPKDAATLLLVDFSGSAPKVLMGRRSARHAFMPNKFVFPGGRVEASDRVVNIAGPLDASVEDGLLKRMQRPSPLKARALALAAIRETYEETGIMLGEADLGGPPVLEGTAWQAFSERDVFPTLDGLHYVARAVTPPHQARRFDTRFFLASADCIAHIEDGKVGPEAELTETVWIEFDRAHTLDLPRITALILDEVRIRIEGGMKPWLPIPFFRQVRGQFIRETL